MLQENYKAELQSLTWNMESADLATGRAVDVMVFSAESHS